MRGRMPMLLVLAALFAGACGGGTGGGEAPSAEGGAPADTAQADNTGPAGAHTGG